MACDVVYLEEAETCVIVSTTCRHMERCLGEKIGCVDLRPFPKQKPDCGNVIISYDNVRRGVTLAIVGMQRVADPQTSTKYSQISLLSGAPKAVQL